MKTAGSCFGSDVPNLPELPMNRGSARYKRRGIFQAMPRALGPELRCLLSKVFI